jgi:hypothetical protein
MVQSREPSQVISRDGGELSFYKYIWSGTINQLLHLVWCWVTSQVISQDDMDKLFQVYLNENQNQLLFLYNYKNMDKLKQIATFGATLYCTQ